MAVSLVGVVFVSNLVVMQYTRAALTAAAEAGARAGAVVGGSLEDCSAKAEAVLRGPDGLLRGAVGEGASVACVMRVDDIEASTSASVRWWLGPRSPVLLEARSVAPLEFDGRLLTGSPQSSGSSGSP